MDNTATLHIPTCIFCNPAVLQQSFYTENRFSALYNIAPILPGHTLIVPNRHCESVDDLTEDELGEMMIFARKVTSVLKTVFGCDGFDWTIQDGVSAGQTVPHLHLHIVCRKPQDLKEDNEWYSLIPENELQLLDSSSRKRLSMEEYTAITTKLAESTAALLNKTV